MKKLLATVLVMCLSISLQANAQGISCSLSADIAYQAMTVRQMNVISKDEYIERIEALKEDATSQVQLDVYDLAISLAGMAYSYPVKSSQPLKGFEAMSFKNTIWSMCL